MKEIILIGTVAVGKTTTAKLLSEKLNKPYVSLDDLRFDYYKEIGYNHEHMKELLEKTGVMGVFQYGKIFDAYSIERVLEDHKDCIFDFGGGNIVCGFEFGMDRIKQALDPYENIVYLTPCNDKEESLEFIYKRRDVKPGDKELIEFLAFNNSNYEIAKHTVFVKDKTPDEVSDEVLLITNNFRKTG